MEQWKIFAKLPPRLIGRRSATYPIHNAIERLYNLYSTQSCDMSHTDVAHVPTDKSMLLLIAYFCEHYKLQSPPYSFSLHTPNYLYDPVTHYIYGLRKIVI